MRPSLLAVLVLGILAASTAPAFAHPAQRDPFNPVISQDALTGATVTDTTETGAVDPIERSFAEVGTDRMPPTGTDVTGWLVLAFTLGVVGAGAIVVAKS